MRILRKHILIDVRYINTWNESHLTKKILVTVQFFIFYFNPALILIFVLRYISNNYGAIFPLFSFRCNLTVNGGHSSGCLPTRSLFFPRPFFHYSSFPRNRHYTEVRKNEGKKKRVCANACLARTMPARVARSCENARERARRKTRNGRANERWKTIGRMARHYLRPFLRRSDRF